MVGQTFHPVGQGLFTSGFITTCDSNPEFQWVYDCGTSNSQKLIQRAVDGLAHGITNEELQMVVLSHFDRDHINGLIILLDKFKIKLLILPYIPLTERLMQAFADGVDSQSEEIGIYIDPIGAIRKLGEEGSIEQIVLVPPSNEAPTAELEGEPLLDGPDGLNIKKGTSCADDNDAVDTYNVIWLEPNSRITYRNTWEFVPYNDHCITRKNNQNFENQVMERADQLRTVATDQARKEALKQLRAIYDAEFGKTPFEKNVISLFLYGGPIGLYQIDKCCPLFGWQYMKPSSTRCGFLMTGDGYLDNETRLDALTSFLEPHGRLAKVSTFQVMHHGSKRNWHRGVASTISPDHSIFCSNPRFKNYNHPNPEVVLDFNCYGPEQVDENRGFSTFHLLSK